MVGTLTTKVIATNLVIAKVMSKAEVMNVPFPKCIIEKLAEILSGLF